MIFACHRFYKNMQTFIHVVRHNFLYLLKIILNVIYISKCWFEEKKNCVVKQFKAESK